tara:strand:+ start:282 stop:596 length:315 start_codon:yes stop_codon:yes gene_type:complete
MKIEQDKKEKLVFALCLIIPVIIFLGYDYYKDSLVDKCIQECELKFPNELTFIRNNSIESYMDKYPEEDLCYCIYFCGGGACGSSVEDVELLNEALEETMEERY